MINITSSMSQLEMLKEAHAVTAIPAMIISYLFFIILFLLSGLFLIDGKKSDYGKFVVIWLVGSLLSGLVIFILCYNPTFVQSIVSGVTN